MISDMERDRAIAHAIEVQPSDLNPLRASVFAYGERSAEELSRVFGEYGAVPGELDRACGRKAAAIMVPYSLMTMPIWAAAGLAKTVLKTGELIYSGTRGLVLSN